MQQSLIDFLPQSQQNVFELTQIVHSPQFRQSLNSLSHACQNGNINAIIATFGLDPSAGQEQLSWGDGIGCLLACIQDFADKKMKE